MPRKNLSSSPAIIGDHEANDRAIRVPFLVATAALCIIVYALRYSLGAGIVQVGSCGTGLQPVGAGFSIGIDWELITVGRDADKFAQSRARL